MRAPLPWSPRRNPQPPIIRTAPPRCTPKTEPVPSVAVMPSASPSAPFSAISASVSIRARAKGSRSDSRAAASATLAPASPSTAVTSPRPAPPAAATASPAAAMMLASAVSGSDQMLAEAACPRPSTRPLASATAARQPDPPPSMPR